MSRPNSPLYKMMTENDSMCPIALRYFKDILEQKSITADEAELIAVAKELGVDFDSLEENLQTILPSMLVYYMKLWPGWLKHSEYVKGELKFAEFYSKFKRYIIFKLNNLIKNVYGNACESVEKENAAKPAEIAPFSIKVEGPASLMSTLVFVNRKDDVLIRQHTAPQLKLSFAELLNWPWVEYEMTFPGMTLIRRNNFKMERFLSGSDQQLMKYTDPELIERSQILDSNKEQVVFKAETLKAYFDKYMSFAKKKHPLIINEVEWTAIFDEFLKDIKDINMENTIATNTAVTFNIGQCRYIRSKQVKNESEPAIKLIEVMTPRVEIILKELAVKPVTTPTSSLEFVFTCDNQTDILPQVTYKCIYCPTKFELSDTVITHLEKEHGMELVLYCFKCHQGYPAAQLVSNRWQHDCAKVVSAT